MLITFSRSLNSFILNTIKFFFTYDGRMCVSNYYAIFSFSSFLISQRGSFPTPVLPFIAYLPIPFDWFHPQCPYFSCEFLWLMPRRFAPPRPRFLRPHRSTQFSLASYNPSKDTAWFYTRLKSSKRRLKYPAPRYPREYP